MAMKSISLLTAIALSGCAMFEPLDDTASMTQQTHRSETEVELEQLIQINEFTQNFEEGSPLTSSIQFQRQVKQNFQQQNDLATIKQLKEQLLKQNEKDVPMHDINYYVRGLMQDLVANLQYVNATTPVAVVSFVMLDSDYNDSNLLGIQIAESLVHEVHKFGIPVIDFKTTGYIRVTEQGDFAFSKDYQDFTGEMPARYIVGGTMVKNTKGYLINARIVGMKSQAVVASAQSFIPNAVAEPILMSATPASIMSNQTVELGSIDASIVAENTRNSMSQNQLINKMSGSSSNQVNLIQE